MAYTIKQVAGKVGLTSYTLRYYEKEGLFPFIKRNEQGNRVFEESDIEWITLICCLRNTGMSISEIRRYIDLCVEGSETIQVRRQIILEHKQELERKIEEMKKYLKRINNKLHHYDNAIEGNGEDACNPNFKALVK